MFLRFSIPRVLLLVVLCLTLPLLLPLTAQALTYDQSVDQLLSQNYPQTLETYLCGLGTSSLGFRNAGSTADNQAATYIRDQMTAAGLANARLEPVPVDLTQFNSASVTVGTRVMDAVPWAGVPGTAPAGITAQVVYVGTATKAEMDAAGNVSGKICLVDYDTANYDPAIQGAECHARGAAAIILTRKAGLTTLFGASGALGAYDALWNLNWGPMLFIKQTDGDWLKSQIASGTVTATFKSDVTVLLGSAGAVGYNVVGDIPGSDPNGQAIVISSHHDAYFSGGIDNTSSVVGMLLMAKAMEMSGYAPERTIIFLFTTGEECGQTDAYYEWLYGAYYAVTQAHQDWPGKIACNINLEMLGYNNRPTLWAETTPDLNAWYRALAQQYLSLSGSSTSLNWIGDVFATSDQAAFAAAGIPSICLFTPWESYYYDNLYHTQFDNTSIVNYTYLGQNMKFIDRLVTSVDGDGAILPYSLSDRGSEISSNVSATKLRSDGADSATVTRLTNAISAFRTAASNYNTRKPTIPSSRYATVNSSLMSIEFLINKGFTAMGAWVSAAGYPHKQVQYDIEQLTTAINNLGTKPKPANALAALAQVSMNFYGTKFDYSAFTEEQARHQPGYSKLGFGGLMQLAPFLDIMPQYNEIVAKQYTQAKAELQAKRSQEITELNARLVKMAQTLETVTPLVNAL